MKHVLNFGSLNIDHVYQFEHFVQPGETLPCSSYQRFAGGKGFNQSIALARAGLRVTHAGRIGQDGEWLREKLADESVGVSTLQMATVTPSFRLNSAEKTQSSSMVVPTKLWTMYL